MTKEEFNKAYTEHFKSINTLFEKAKKQAVSEYSAMKYNKFLKVFEVQEAEIID